MGVTGSRLDGVLYGPGGYPITGTPGAGKVLQFDGANWAWQAPAGTWTTAFDIDFTTETPQVLSPDGPYTIGGLTWTKFNSANDNAAMYIDATGLVITPKAATNHDSADRSIPAISVPLSGLIPSFSHETRLRAMMYVSVQNCTANFDASILAFDTGNMNWMSQIKHGYYGADKGCVGTMVVASTNQGYNADAFNPLSAANVFRLDLLPCGEQKFASYRGVYAAGWPSSWTPQASYVKSGTDIGTKNLVVGNMLMILGAMRGGSGTALVIKIARVKLEYKNV